MKYLNTDGLTYFWNKAKETFAASSHSHSEYASASHTHTVFSSDVRFTDGAYIRMTGGKIFIDGYEVLTELNASNVLGQAEDGAY